MRAIRIGCVKGAAAIAAALLFAVWANAASAQKPLIILGLKIPDRVGGLPHGKVHDYESTNKGLGYSIPFESRGWSIDVYLYDFGLRSIPDDPQAEAVTKHLKQAKGDVFELERRGYYAEVVDKGDYNIGRKGRTRFVCSMFGYIHKQMNAKVDSYLCLTSWHNKFFKIRMTTPQSDTSNAEATKFVESWIDLLWPSS